MPTICYMMTITYIHVFKYLQLYRPLQLYYLSLLTLAGCVAERHHCTTPTNTDHGHQEFYTNLHHSMLNLLPRFLFESIYFYKQYK